MAMFSPNSPVERVLSILMTILTDSGWPWTIKPWKIVP